MQAHTSDRESKPCRSRSGSTSAIAAALCAMGAAAALLAPASATAMTSEELVTICSSVFAEIGDPSVCAANFPSSSGGSVATEPSPGVVVILDSKPDPNRVSCGSGFDAARLEDCFLKKRRPGQGLGLVADGGPTYPWMPPLGIPGVERKASKPGSLKRCALAQGTLSEAADVLKDLKKLQDDPSAWGPDGSLRDKKASGDLRKLYAESDSWFSSKVRAHLRERMKELPSLTDRDYLNLTETGWELTKKEVRKDLADPACGNRRNV